MKQYWRHQVLLRGKYSEQMRVITRQTLDKIKKNHKVYYEVDVDPVHLL